MAKSNRENPVFDSLSPTGKAVRAIDIYRFPDGNTKITFVRNVPKKDAAGEIIGWDKKTFYEFVSNVPNDVDFSKISMQNFTKITYTE